MKEWNQCRECGAILWSDFYIGLQQCPECNGDNEKDAPTELEELLKEVRE